LGELDHEIATSMIENGYQSHLDTAISRSDNESRYQDAN